MPPPTELLFLLTECSKLETDLGGFHMIYESLTFLIPTGTMFDFRARSFSASNLDKPTVGVT